MRMPDVLSSLVDEGIIEAVLRPLMSGKEAQIYLVEAAGQQYVAKIYKEAKDRTFKHRSDYTEGRRVRNSRDQRAIDKRSKHGRGQDEAAWRSTEVDMIYRLQAAGVRVPVPHQFIDGVLIMELVVGKNGEPAPRLGDARVGPEQATAIYEQLIRETVRMLCAGVVHGDLSDFNVLLGADGPVIIDFPQSVDPSKNLNARKLLLRDVDNLHRFLTRRVPGARRLPYAEEMWALYESNRLTPDTTLSGEYRASRKRTDTRALLDFIGEVKDDAMRARGPRPATARRTNETPAPRPRRVEFVVQQGSGPGSHSKRPRRVEVVVKKSISSSEDSRRQTETAPQESGVAANRRPSSGSNGARADETPSRSARRRRRRSRAKKAGADTASSN